MIDIKLWKKCIYWKCISLQNPNEILGTLGIYEEPDNIVYISAFYVTESRRGNGIGKRLWDICFDYIQEINEQVPNSKYKVQLITVKDIMRDAYSFYLKAGFVEVPLDFQTNNPAVVKMELLV